MEITHAVINIMDKNINSAVFSQKELPLREHLVQEYVQKIVEKFLKSECITFGVEQSEPALYLASDEDNFLMRAEQLTQHVFESLAGWQEVPTGDMLFIEAVDQMGANYVGMLKLDYSVKYTHLVDYDDNNQVVNKIQKNEAILPAPTQALNTGIIIKDQKTCFVRDRKYKDVQGDWSFQENVLEVKEKQVKTSDEINAVKKALKSVAKKYDLPAYEVAAEAQTVVYEGIGNEGQINNETLAQAVFKENYTAKQEFLAELDKKEMAKQVDVTANAPIFEKKYQKQKLKLDNGIEITVPVELLKNKDVIEFINQEDGSLEVVLRNIDSIKNSF